MKRGFDMATSTSIVVANMIGTGVFATLGLQLELHQSMLSILLAWLIGGVIALTGSISYARLSRIIPQSGGEYTYISRLVSPALGFAAGIISIVAGFAAPLALTAITFGSYLENVVGIDPVMSAILLIATLAFVHAFSAHYGGRLHLWITILKVVIIAGFTLSAFFTVNTSTFPHEGLLTLELFNDNFASSLLYVSFAYSGWNAACYVSEEVKDRQKNLTRSLLTGTALVTVLYLVVNFALLLTAPNNSAGSIDIVHPGAVKLWGASGAKIMDAFISMMLISSASSLVIAGPRVMMKLGSATGLESIGLDKPFQAVMLQSVIAVVLLVSFSFQFVLYYTGLTLSIFTMLTVAALLLKERGEYFFKSTMVERIASIIFILVNGWVVYQVAVAQPAGVIASVVIIIITSLLYTFLVRKNLPRLT